MRVTVLVNADIRTMDRKRPRAEAVSFARGRIVEVGKERAVLAKAGDNARLLDAGGRTVLPGFIDCHTHFLSLGVWSNRLDLSATRSLSDLLDAVKNRAFGEVKRAGAGKGNHARGRMLGAGLVIVAGRNFGVGSSREQAPIALKAAGISAVVAGSFGRIFFRNAINLGLPVLKCPGAADAVKDGETVTVDIAGGIVRRGRGAPVLECEPLPPFLLEILEDGGLVAHVRRRFPYGKT